MSQKWLCLNVRFHRCFRIFLSLRTLGIGFVYVGIILNEFLKYTSMRLNGFYQSIYDDKLNPPNVHSWDKFVEHGHEDNRNKEPKLTPNKMNSYSAKHTHTSSLLFWMHVASCCCRRCCCCCTWVAKQWMHMVCTLSGEEKGKNSLKSLEAIAEILFCLIKERSFPMSSLLFLLITLLLSDSLAVAMCCVSIFWLANQYHLMLRHTHTSHLPRNIHITRSHGQRERKEKEREENKFPLKSFSLASSAK